jgi:hypothetical protein
MDTPAAQLVLRTALIVPRIACEMAFARAVLGDTVPMSTELFSFGAVLSGIQYGIAGVPWDLVARTVADVWDPIGDDGGIGTSSAIGHFLSTSHPLADRRSYSERWQATLSSVFYTSGVAGVIMAYSRVHLEETLSEVGLDWGVNALELPWWVQGLLSFVDPDPDLTVGDLFWALLHMAPYSLPFGAVFGWPTEWIYHRIVYRPLKRALFEDDEHHMHRKLRHARRHTNDLHGIVAPASSSAYGEGPSEELVSEDLAAATESLDSKREALLERCGDLLDSHRIRQGGSTSDELKLRLNRVDGLGPVLAEFATVSQSALLAGNLEVEFEGELGMDMGGVSRDFFEDILSV